MTRLSLSAAAVSLAFGSQPPAQLPTETAVQSGPVQTGDSTPGSERFAEQLDALDAATAKIEDLRADFEQRRRTPLLKEPLVSRGVVLTKGELVRWVTATPRASCLSIGRDSITMYYIADKLVEVYPVGEGYKDLAGSPVPRMSVLRASYDITQLSIADLGMSNEDEGFLAVQLTPRIEALKAQITSVKVLIDVSMPAAVKVVITDPDMEATEIEFSNIRINSGLTDEEVSPKLPEGVHVSHPLGVSKKEPHGPTEQSTSPAAAPPMQDGKP